MKSYSERMRLIEGDCDCPKDACDTMRKKVHTAIGFMQKAEEKLEDHLRTCPQKPKASMIDSFGLKVNVIQDTSMPPDQFRFVYPRHITPEIASQVLKDFLKKHGVIDA